MRSKWSESWSHYEKDEVKDTEIVIPNVRLKSEAGWYVGAVEFSSFDEMGFYSRDTGYYPSEKFLIEEFPHSISIQEAQQKIRQNPLYKRKMERKLNQYKIN